uniref:HCP-like protein n=1 Tax=Mycena chlorophos TaxID=658473 RepID=A0ABQ0LW88_MYCCL|nr:predicted protein [Mycena chlorophos]
MMATAPQQQQQSMQFSHSSPLDTLVRKTSARRKPPAQINTVAREPYQTHHAAPSSPLLHSQFNRQSNATWDAASTMMDGNSSYLDLSRDDEQDEQDAYGGFESPDAPFAQPAFRDSWQSSSTGQPGISDWPAVPIVTVSAPVSGYQAGKTAIINPSYSNFSRPARSAVELPDAYEDEQKRRVLERNASARKQDKSSPLRNESRPDSATFSIYSTQSAATARGRSPEPPRPNPAPGEPVALPRRPPSLRNNSPVSLYSTYSFYQLDSASPSPTADKTFQSRAPSRSGMQPQQQSRDPSPQPRSPHVAFANSAPPQRALEFLQLGITHHENDRLAESAVCFEKAATVDGGCGVGMLMWGLALRHGWGCTKNEKSGFKWLRRAAEHAVSDLEAARQGGAIDESAVQTELILAIYEVGQCFFHGWGIAKDAKMGVSYYQVAARMGDADAQMDLGFCLANGKGAKKDRKAAAKWYREAVKQGQSDIGLAWIYKEKFQ